MKLPVLILILIASAGCSSQTKAPQDLELVEYGTFRKLSSDKDVRDPGSITGTRHTVAQVALIKCTTNVPARIGTSFGFRVKFPGTPSNRAIPCTAKCFHPEMHDPSSGRSSVIDEWDASGLSGED